MSFSHTSFTRLRRPRLLIRAARHGLNDYDRKRVLPRILDGDSLRDRNATIAALLKAEAGIEDERKADAATYSIPRHIEVLIALMGEMRCLAGAEAKG